MKLRKTRDTNKSSIRTRKGCEKRRMSYVCLVLKEDDDDSRRQPAGFETSSGPTELACADVTSIHVSGPAVALFVTFDLLALALSNASDLFGLVAFTALCRMSLGNK